MNAVTLTLPLQPSPRLAWLLAVLHLGAVGALALLEPPLPLLVAAAAALVAQATACIRRDALGTARGAPVALELRSDASALLLRRGQPAVRACLAACSVRIPGLVVLDLATADGRVGVLLTRGRTGSQAWRRLQVMARWGLGSGLSRPPVNSPGPDRSLGP